MINQIAWISITVHNRVCKCTAILHVPMGRAYKEFCMSKLDNDAKYIYGVTLPEWKTYEYGIRYMKLTSWTMDCSQWVLRMASHTFASFTQVIVRTHITLVTHSIDRCLATAIACDSQVQYFTPILFVLLISDAIRTN